MIDFAYTDSIMFQAAVQLCFADYGLSPHFIIVFCGFAF